MPRTPIAPPNTYRKISRNITPWIVPSTTSCGVRMNFFRARLATTSVLARSVVGWVAGRSVVVVVVVVAAIVTRSFLTPSFALSSVRGAGGGLGTAPLALSVGRLLLESLAGESQEHLVELRRAKGDVVDG